MKVSSMGKGTKKKRYHVRHESAQRTKMLTVRVTEEEHRIITERAEEHGYSVADMMRRFALGQVISTPPSAENRTQWVALGKHAHTLNQAVRMLYRVLEALEEVEEEGKRAEKKYALYLSRVERRSKVMREVIEEAAKDIRELRGILIGELTDKKELSKRFRWDERERKSEK